MVGTTPPVPHRPDDDRPTAIVLAGGDPPPAAVLRALPRGVPVVAADSGLDHALALGLSVDLVVGDLDSATPEGIRAARAAGARFARHPVDKDATDFELALLAARAEGARRLVAVGGAGGRHDHQLANLLVLAGDALADVEIDAWIGTARCRVVRTHRSIPGPTGSLCSLIPAGGPARGVTTEGLRFALRGEDLLPGSTRGVSNEIAADPASVSLTAGVLLVVQPHALEEA